MEQKEKLLQDRLLATVINSRKEFSALTNLSEARSQHSMMPQSIIIWILSHSVWAQTLPRVASIHTMVNKLTNARTSGFSDIDQVHDKI